MKRRGNVRGTIFIAGGAPTPATRQFVEAVRTIVQSAIGHHAYKECDTGSPRAGRWRVLVVSFSPVFSNSLDLHALSTSDLTAIVGELDEIAHSIDSIQRASAIWRSLTAAPLYTTVNNWMVEYKIDSAAEKLTVLSFRR